MSRSLLQIILMSVLAPIFAVPAIVQAQETTSAIPSVTIRANTRLVVVDVVVTNKKGQPIAGLTVNDFTVEESGKKQKIATFTPPGGNQGAPQPVPPGLLTNKAEYIKPAGVPTVLLLDAADSHFLDQAYGRGQMLKYVLEQSGPGSPMAVMTLTDRLQVLQDFTSDPRVLLTAIKRLQPQEPILLAGTMPAEGAGLASLISTSQTQLVSFQSQAVGYVLERRTQVTIQALHELSRVLGGFPGRKNVVWLTADFPFDLIPQDTNMGDAELLADLPSIANTRNNVIVNSGGQALAQQRGMFNQQIREAQFAVASAGIAVYPVDMRGLMTSGIDVNTTSSLAGCGKTTARPKILSGFRDFC